MNVRRVSAAVLSVTTLLVASMLTSCGSSGGVTSGTSSKLPTVTIEYSPNADDAIVRIGTPGWLPSLVIGGDGWAYQPSSDAGDWTSTESMRPSVGRGPQAAVAPAPPEPTPVERRLLTPEGVQIVLALADQLGLLAVPGEYEDPGVTDSGSTYVRLSVAAGTFEHDAYALGFDDETGNRRNLEQFVDAVADLETLVGSKNIGPAEAYVPAIFAVSMYNGYSYDDEITWPDGVPVEVGCVALPVDRFPSGVAGLFTADVGGAPTQVSVLPDLPGDECTADSNAPEGLPDDVLIQLGDYNTGDAVDGFVFGPELVVYNDGSAKGRLYNGGDGGDPSYLLVDAQLDESIVQRLLDEADALPDDAVIGQPLEDGTPLLIRAGDQSWDINDLSAEPFAEFVVVLTTAVLDSQVGTWVPSAWIERSSATGECSVVESPSVDPGYAAPVFPHVVDEYPLGPLDC